MLSSEERRLIIGICLLLMLGAVAIMFGKLTVVKDVDEHLAKQAK